MSNDNNVCPSNKTEQQQTLQSLRTSAVIQRTVTIMIDSMRRAIINTVYRYEASVSLKPLKNSSN